MLEPIFYGIVLTMLQVMFIPLAFELSSPGGINYLFGNRADSIKFPEIAVRINRAGSYIKENIAIYLALGILSLLNVTVNLSSYLIMKQG